ncbi:MAG: hypothetical protein ISN28_11550 [Ectothiorhodospiraceae bacterium AqS1]|nr:hypothetical protein [Ectothiorhodospiraceae bacterium AqS1]
MTEMAASPRRASCAASGSRRAPPSLVPARKGGASAIDFVAAGAVVGGDR